MAAALYHAAGRGGAGAEEGAAGGEDGLLAAGGAEWGCGVAVVVGLRRSAVASKAARSLRCTLGVEGGGEGGGELLVGGVCGCGAAGGAVASDGGAGVAVVLRLVAGRVLLAGVRAGRRRVAAGAVAGAATSMERVMRLKVGVSAAAPAANTRPLRGLSVGERGLGEGLNRPARVRGMALNLKPSSG